MAATQFQEAGSNATGGLEFYTSTTGTVASDTAVFFLPDNRSIECTCDASGNPAYATKSGIMADAGRRLSCYRYFDALPDNGADATSGRPIFTVITSGAATCFNIGLRSTGIMTITTGGVSVPGTTALSTATWYRISVSYVITSTTNFTIKVYINGVLEITMTNASATLSNASSDGCRFGYALAAAVAAMANKACHFSNVYVDNGTDLADTGNILVSAFQPSANDLNQFDTNIGANPANRWTNVNEIPISITNGWEEVAGGGLPQERYGLEAPSLNDQLTNALIISRTAWIWAKATTGSSGSPGIIDNYTVTAITLTNAAALYTVTTDGASYPANIGMQAAGTTATFLYECGTIISYIPGGQPNTTQALLRG